MKWKFLKTILICMCLLTFWFISGCALYDLNEFMEETEQQAAQAKKEGSGSSVKKLTSSKSQITLAWDKPTGDVQSYRIYYREHGTSSWEYLDTVVGPDQTEFTVSYSALSKGSYDFAVTAVDSEDVESTLHTSLDSSADPDTGWYLSWEQ